MRIEVLTFGFKHGMPDGVDMVFDVRFLANPFWVDELKDMTGLDAPVRDYVFSFENSRELLDRLCGLMDFLVAQFEADGRERLVVAIGCTGGKHRSVSVAERLAAYLNASVSHRDIRR